MANTKVTTNVIADDAITGAKIADDAINSEHYTDGSIDTAHIADDQVTLAKMAGLARGKIIYGDASGNPAALAVGSNGQVLKSDGTDIAWGTDSTVAALTSEEVQDIVGAMFSSNTETGITATYQDADGTVDLVVGTLNQDTTGTAATVTGAAQTNITSLGTLTALTVDDITIDGSTISDGADLTLDVAGDIILDADGGDLKFYDGGTNIGNFVNSSSDFAIEAMVQDKDILFKGDDGGSGITALTLDMSDAGKATFNAGVVSANNSDTQSIFGRTALGFVSGLSDYAYIGHLDVADSGGYALVQSAAGATFLNAEDGQNLSFSIHGTRKMVLEAGGDVGIGTTDPASHYGFGRTLEVQGSANAEINISQTDNSKNWSLGIVNGSNYQQTDNSQYIWEIGGSEELRLDGDGVKFNGDTAAANALNDYEEGNWTPTVGGASGAGSTSGGNIYGKYIKIGDLVFASFSIANTTISSASGHLTIGGFPFNNSGTGDREAVGVMRVYGVNIGALGTYGTPLPAVNNNTNTAFVLQSGDDAAWNVVQVSNDSGQYFEGSITYIAT
tara:strand:+ start:13066 stop:14745 length:1680 start_codon:yes stop_codon:yes gene_type:complete